MDNLSKIKDGTYAINLDGHDVTYFDSFGVKHIAKEIKAIIGNKKIKKIFLEYNHMIR